MLLSSKMFLLNGNLPLLYKNGELFKRLPALKTIGVFAMSGLLNTNRQVKNEDYFLKAK
jgi:hypothetical protein